MNNQINLLEEREVVLAEGTKKLSLRGQTKNYDVKRIPLNLLFYNSKNNRIATWISKYNAESGNIDDLNNEARNNIIEQYIIKSNPTAYKKTKDNIQTFAQREAGVVLTDGRVIDGNRRFTCLRKLFDETTDPQFGYFEAVILDHTIEDKEIKMLELELQHGHEEKIGYDAIENLVGIYNDLIKNPLLTVEEYARSMDVKPAKVNESIEIAKLMMDFLDYINASEQFYVARELEIDGPLKDIYNVKKRLNNDELWEKARIVLFDNMLMKTSGDITRVVRRIGNDILNSSYFDSYYEKHEPLSEQINAIVSASEDVVDTEYIRKEIRENEVLKKKLYDNYEDVLNSVRKDTVRNMPVSLISDARDSIKRIDLISISKLNSEEKTAFNEELVYLKEELSQIEVSLNESN